MILVALAAAFPALPLTPGFGVADNRVMVKFAPSAVDSGLVGARQALGQHVSLTGHTVRPRASGRLPGWFEILGPDAPSIARALQGRREVEWAYLAATPVPPPADLPPSTPDFRPDQTWLEVGDGLGFTEAAHWPGGRGEYVTIADVEYGWDETHEDLETTIGAAAGGWQSGLFVFHGNSVLGELVGGDNGYGIAGAVPEASIRMVSPFASPDDYDVAAAITLATTQLGPGDVILIEQQAIVLGSYGPVEIDPGVFEAIQLAVAAGIVVVEPAGNGAVDLDSPALDGWFDRDTHDSGAIVVGGGASPYSGHPVRSWYPFGSSYGSRVDVQAWYDGIVTASGGDYNGYYADLYFPDGDDRQAYTASFGGTSGASPMVTAMVAVLQSVAIASGGQPWDPRDVRSVLRGTGTPQTGDLATSIGPQPDLRRLLRIWGG